MSAHPAASRSHRSFPYGLACAAVFLLSELLAHAWVEMPLEDDWSYIRTAEILSRTGHIVYNGWATAMIGWQLYLGAAMVRLFGPSFTAPRLSTLLLGALTAWLIQRTLVRFGIAERRAALGACILTLSPIFLEWSATFMSDIPGMFALVLAFYCCLRALQARGEGAAIAWICFAAFGNAILGSCRQIAWLGVFPIVPAALWLLRRRKAVLWAGLIANGISFILVVAQARWFLRQPYSLNDRGLFHLQGWHPGHMLWQLGEALLEIFLLAGPLLFAFVPGFTRAARRFWMVVAALIAADAACVIAAARSGHVLPFAVPFLRFRITSQGHFDLASATLIHAPTVLSVPAQILLNALFLIGLCSLIYFLAQFARGQHTSHAGTPYPSPAGLLILLAPFCLVYFSLLIPRSTGGLADRYCLPLAFVAVVALLRLWEATDPSRYVRLVLAATAVLAFCGIAATHDYFADYRAEKQLIAELNNAGVPPQAIDGGWDYDGWTELQFAGHVNDPRIAIPPHAYHRKKTAAANPCLFGLFVDLFPHVDPRYGIRFYEHDCQGRADFPPVTYRRWLELGRPATLYAVRELPQP